MYEVPISGEIISLSNKIQASIQLFPHEVRRKTKQKSAMFRALHLPKNYA